MGITLHSIFKSYEFKIDFSKAFPDFVITYPYSVCVEAIITNNAYNAKPEYERNPAGDDIPSKKEIVKTTTVRLANAIIYKYKEKLLKIRLCKGEKNYFSSGTV